MSWFMLENCCPIEECHTVCSMLPVGLVILIIIVVIVMSFILYYFNVKRNQLWDWWGNIDKKEEKDERK